MTENKPFKLNLGALKDNTDKQEDINKSLDSKIETKGNSMDLKKEINLTNSKEDKKEATNINISHKIDLSKLKENKEAKSDLKKEKINEIKTDEIIENKVESKEVFGNYESDFKKENKTILQRIEKFKNFVKPKTRLGFITMLIGITTFGIASLFVINPKVHNLTNYKANILKAKENIECKLDNNKCKKIIKKPIIKEKPIIKSKSIKKDGFTINYNSKIINGKEIIIYKGIKYDNINDFNKKLNKEIRNKKTKKLQEYLKNTKNKQ